MALSPRAPRTVDLRLITAVAAALLGLATLVSCAAAPAAAAASNPEVPPAGPATPTAAVVWGGPRDYGVEELAPIINRALKAGGRDFERGKATFQTLGCPICHHFNEGVGGIGPDISGVGGRMGVAGLLTEILEPSRYISDLFGTKTVTTKDGETFTGRLKGQDGEFTTLIQNFTIDPATMTATWEGGALVNIKTSDIDTVEDSGISPMPPGLINGIKEDQVADLLAFLISGGDPANKMFQTPPATPRTGATKQP